MSRQAVPSYRRRGISLIAATVTMPLMLGFAGLAVDVGMSHALQSDLQRTADAAALAAAQDLGGSDPAVGMANAQATILSLVIKNPAYNSTPILVDPLVDVVFGRSSLVIGSGGKVSFSPNVTPPSAVQVTVHATMDYTFAKALGFGSRDVSATAIAVIGPRDFVVIIDCSGSMTKQSDEIEVETDLDVLGIAYVPNNGKESALKLTYDGSDPQFAGVYSIGDKFLPPSVRIQPMKATKDAAAYSVGIVENAGFNDLMGAVAFSSTIDWTEQLTSDYARVRAKLLGATKYGGTKINLGIQAARLELLSPRGRPGADKVMVLMTDGHSDFAATMTEAQLAADAGITVHTIGLGNVDTLLLDSIAALTPHGRALYVTNYTDATVYGPQLEAVFESLASDVGYILIR